MLIKTKNEILNTLTGVNLETKQQQRKKVFVQKKYVKMPLKQMESNFKKKVTLKYYNKIALIIWDVKILFKGCQKSAKFLNIGSPIII